MIVKQNVPIRQITTFQSDGEIDRLILIETIDELSAYLKEARPFCMIGKGSNMVVSPQLDADLVMISPKLFMASNDGELLTVNAGVTVNRLMNLLLIHELTGLEFMAGVPASVGGMVTMNFGCWGHSVADFFYQAEVMTRQGVRHTVLKKGMAFGYRYSNVQVQDWIVLSVTFKLASGNRGTIEKTIQDNIQTRLNKQPLRAKTFGSVFKNPDTRYAAQLIELSGLKGYQQGNIQVSDHHANFFINLGNATFQQLQDMVTTVQQKVLNTHNVLLEPEVKLAA